MVDQRHTKLLTWGPVGLWLAAQLTATSLPASALPSVEFSLDDVVHFGMYAGLAVLVWRAAERAGRTWRPVAILAALSLFGALDELHQLFIPGRSCSALDWLADTVGVAAGLWVAPYLLRTRWLGWLK